MANNMGHKVKKKGNLPVEQKFISSANNSQMPSTKIRKEVRYEAALHMRIQHWPSSTSRELPKVCHQEEITY
jgi:hypothetical protein